MWAALPRIQGHGKKNALQWRRGQRNKDSVREIKQTEKVQAQNSSDLCVFCFDLEKVLELPYANVSSMYYKRKLAVYNLSIFDICTKEATCYIVHVARDIKINFITKILNFEQLIMN